MPPPLPLRVNTLKQLLLPKGISKYSPLSSSSSSNLYKTPIPGLNNNNKQIQCIRSFSNTPNRSRDSVKAGKGVSKWEVKETKKNKKKGKGSSDISSSSSSSSSETKETTEGETIDDAFDFSTLEAGIQKSIEKLGHDLGKLRTGGRFNPEVLENVRVVLEKGTNESIRLGELAQVLPKGGRTVMVLVGEKDHIKPITSAIQGAKDLNLQPQPDTHNPSQLNIPIPPPTKESRDVALAAATKAGETAKIGVQSARAAMQKRLRGMELRKSVRPDDLKKAHKEMEKVVEKGVGEVKKAVESARKGMEQS